MSDVKSIDVGGALFVDKCVPSRRESPPFARSRVRDASGPPMRARRRLVPIADPPLTAPLPLPEPQVL